MYQGKIKDGIATALLLILFSWILNPCDGFHAIGGHNPGRSKLPMRIYINTFA
jgi:hypothetical protein